MSPDWLHWLSIVSLAVAFVCAAWLVVDVIRHPQHMGIMNVVWPATALFGGVAAVVAYYRWGRLATRRRAMAALRRAEKPPHRRLTPFPVMVGKGATHCGSGCALGDICAEWLAWLFPVIATWAGWHVVFAEKMFAVWVVDYILAFLFGVAFQYFTIVPMRGLSVGRGIIQAVKADVLSLTAWQAGMYGFMALAAFWIFEGIPGYRLEVASAEFWFMMQIAMWCGFLTSYPVNWWLIRRGIKERM